MQLNFLNRFFTTITKPKFVITLILLTLIAAFIGVMIPQISDKSPSYFETWKLKSPETFYIVNFLQLNRVYISVWFLSLVFIILLSLGYSIYLQVKRNIKVHSKDVHGSWFMVRGKDVYSSSFIVHGGNEQSTMNDERIIKLMRKKGYRLVHGGNGQSTMNDEQIMIFSKHSISRWGGTIFHSGLFLIIVAAIIGLAFQQRGFVQLMEGEVLSGRHEEFLVREFGVFQKRFDTGFKTQLSKFRHEYWETGQVKEVSSPVTLIDDKGDTYEDTVSPNHPVRYKGVNIYQSFDYGYVLSFALKRPDGSETVTHFLLDRPDKRTKPFTGETDFPQTTYIFNMKFYPDISMNSFYLGRPILYLKVLNGNNMVFNGLIIPGNIVNVEGNLLRLFNISQWSGLIYTKSPDMSPAYAGFFISCIGAAVIFLLPYKEIFILVKGSVLSLYGRTNKYKPLFDEEMEEIKRKIKEFI